MLIDVIIIILVCNTLLFIVSVYTYSGIRSKSIFAFIIIVFGLAVLLGSVLEVKPNYYVKLETNLKKYPELKLYTKPFFSDGVINGSEMFRINRKLSRIESLKSTIYTESTESNITNLKQGDPMSLPGLRAKENILNSYKNN